MRRVLVIEDEVRILSLLARALEAEAFEVDGADNGADGLARALRGAYDLVALDLARRQARLGSNETDLSDREFRLLHLLVTHAGEVVTRESILSTVWGCHFDPRSNVVDVCVRRLRKKLGQEAPIETVRHAGYRLAA